MMLVIVLFTCFLGATAVHDPNFCTLTPSQVSPVPIPQLPATFWTSVEAKFDESKNTIDIFEYYDDTNKRGNLAFVGKGKSQRVLYNFNDQQAIVIDLKARDKLQPNTCKVHKLADFNDNFLLGGGVSTDGSIRIVGANAVFKFSELVNKKYVGKETIRGISTHHWHSCYYWDSIEASFKIDWWFSESGAWNNAVNISSAPVRISVDGKYSQDGASPGKTFKHTYDITRFRTGFNRQDTEMFFQVPDGYFCDGMKSDKVLPQLPDRFSIRAEQHSVATNETSYSHYEYDFPANISRIVYEPIAVDPMRKYGGSLTVIHDYLHGVEYVLNNELGNCSYGPVPQMSADSVRDKNNPTLLHMKSPRQLFLFDDVPIYYKGKKTIRNQETEVYMIRRDDFPIQLVGIEDNLDATFEYGFKIFRTSDGSGGGLIEKAVPVWININSVIPVLKIDTSYYDYQDGVPSSRKFDVSKCFLNHLQRHFAMRLDVNSNEKSIIMKDINSLKDSFILSAAVAASVSPLRISNVDVYVDSSDDLTVEFTIMERALVQGDVQNPRPELTLPEAVAKMTKSVNSNEFSIIFATFESVFNINIKENGYNEIQALSTRASTSQGYSPGLVGGIGFLLTLLGILGGLITTFFYLK